MKSYDFSGWATRNNLKCSDGRTIMKDAFKHNDGQKVPLVWNHQHNDPLNVLGHALLENRDEGVYAYCTFNDTDAGKNAKLLVEHGDVSALSIYANQLKQQGGNVLHGAIREVSLVLAGANPGAFIDSVIRHSDNGEYESDDEGIIYTGINLVLAHSEEQEQEQIDKEKESMNETLNHSEKEPAPAEGKTVQEVFDSMTEEQKTVVYALIGQAIEDASKDEDEEEETKPQGGNNTMKHNIFDQEETQMNNTLSHSDMEVIVADAKRRGSLKDAMLAHCEANGLSHAVTDAEGNEINYGMANIGYLYPDAKTVNPTPSFIARDMGWVQKVMKAIKHVPFSRIKSVHADITEADARAKGYVKGNQKVEEVFALLKRITTPTTVYKKQKLDRDDMVDITDFDVVAWLKSEMRLMLDEEIARAVLVGDGRSGASNDKINELCIRPVWTDEALYTIKKRIDFAAADTADQRAKKFIRTIVKARKNYKGSGTPTLYTTEDMLTDCLLMEDNTGRVIYDSVEKLATALRVKEIVTVPVMEGLTRVGTQLVDGDTDTRALLGIVVNLADYSSGADKGGAVNLFDDFDIDFNQQKYLIETRCSGALTVPYSAIAIEAVEAAG